jgi:DDE superfamily endonuclease
MLVIPSFAQPSLGPFAPVFLQPTYQRFLVPLVAATLTTGRRTVSHLLRTVPGLAPGDPSSSHRVFSKRRWSALLWARLLAKFLLDHHVADGPIFRAGDDTVDEHRGAKVHGTGCHRDPVRSTHSFTAYRWGHKGVVLTILVQFPFAVRPWALPVLVALYRSADQAEAKAKTKTKTKTKKVKDKIKAKAKRRARGKAATATPKRRHKTPSELMRQLLAVLIPWFPDRQFVCAGDGGPGTHALARFAHRHRRHLSLVRLFDPDAHWYDPPPAVVGKRNGRPREKGDKRPTPEAVVAATSGPTALNVSW